MISKLFSVWEGVYNSFAEADGDLDAFHLIQTYGLTSKKIGLRLH